MTPFFFFFSLFFLFISYLSLSYSLILTTEALNNNQPYHIPHGEAFFCTALSPNLAFYDLIFISGEDACQNITFDNITGKAILLRGDRDCLRAVQHKNLYEQGAGLIIAYPGYDEDLEYHSLPLFTASDFDWILPISCLGLTYQHGAEIQTILDQNISITVTTYQRAIHPSQIQPLQRVVDFMHGWRPWSPWDPDICTVTLPTYPSRPINWLACDEEGMITILTNLEYGFGELPIEIANFTELWMFALYYLPHIVGTVPIEYKSWTKLEFFALSSTQINYISPDLFVSWKSLQLLDLSSNRINASFPYFLGEIIGQIYIQDNFFYGEIDLNLFNGTDAGLLTWVDVSNNLLTGILPDFSRFYKLIGLLLSYNRFVDFAGVGVPASLWSLELGANGLSEIPSGVINATQMISLDLSFNKFSSLPDLSTLTLQALNLAGNQLTGSFDFSSIAIDPNCNCSTLLKVILSQNKITSLENVEVLTQLTHFQINSNNLTVLPDMTKVNPDGFSFLDISNNSIKEDYIALTKKIPPSPAFQFFYARGNAIFREPQFVGEYIDFQNFPFASEIDLSYNNISLWGPRFSQSNKTLPVPESSLRYLRLSNNRLQGSLDKSLANQNFITLSLASNGLRNDGSGQVIPDWMDYTFNQSNSLVQYGVECPTMISKINEFTTITLDPAYYHYELCRCLPNYYWIPVNKSQDQRCHNCLTNALCPGGEGTFLNDSSNLNIVAMQGYYPLPNKDYPIAIVPCQFGVMRPNTLDNPCNQGINQLPLPSSTNKFTCAYGYEGRLCSKCIQGFYSQNGRCLRCDTEAKYPTFLVLLILLLFTLSFFFLFPIFVEKYEEYPPAIFQVLTSMIDFFQTISLTTSRLDSPSTVASMLSLVGVAAVSTPATSGVGPECLTGFPSFRQIYIWTMAAPGLWTALLMTLFIFKILFLLILRSKLDLAMEIRLLLRGILIILTVVYLPIGANILNVFRCTRDPTSGIYYFSDAPYLECNALTATEKYVPVAVYLIGVVVLFSILNWVIAKNPDRRYEPENVTLFGFFYSSYQADHMNAGVFFLILRFTLSVVVGFADWQNDNFPISICWILNVKLCYLIFASPYRSQMLNILETACTIVVIFIFVNTLIYSSNYLFDTRGPATGVTWILLVSGIVLFALVCIITDCLKNSKNRGKLLSNGVNFHVSVRKLEVRTEGESPPISPTGTPASINTSIVEPPKQSENGNSTPPTTTPEQKYQKVATQRPETGSLRRSQSGRSRRERKGNSGSMPQLEPDVETQLLVSPDPATLSSIKTGEQSKTQSKISIDISSPLTAPTPLSPQSGNINEVVSPV